MGVGKRVVQLRHRSGLSQRDLARAGGFNVSYLSRLENERITPTVSTLSRLADGLGVPVVALLGSGGELEASDRCPVSLSGGCILDLLHSAHGRRPKSNLEVYSPEQLEALRLCNLVLHAGDRKLTRTLRTILESLLALRSKQNGNSAE